MFFLNSEGEKMSPLTGSELAGRKSIVIRCQIFSK